MQTVVASKVVEALCLARDLVAAGWTQRALARDEEGRPVRYLSETARYWCAVGALYAGSGLEETTSSPVKKAFRILNRLTMGEGGITSFNDLKGRTQDEVLQIFDEAIEYATQHLDE